MSRPSCSSPRACTSKASPAPFTITRSDTLVAASFARRSPILLPVSCVPSLPASGESFGENTMLHESTMLLQGMERYPPFCTCFRCQQGHAADVAGDEHISELT